MKTWSEQAAKNIQTQKNWLRGPPLDENSAAGRTGPPPAARRGATEAGYIHACDWYRTILGLAGLTDAQITDQRAAAAGFPPLDSLDVWPLLAGTASAPPMTTERLLDGAPVVV